MRQTKLILISLLSCVALYFVMDRALGVVLHEIYEKSQRMDDVRFRYIMDECDQDMLMMGASRTSHHYVSSILEDSLGVSVCNIGMDGAGSIFWQYAELGMILQRYTPKVICMEMGFMLLGHKPMTMGNFAPYIGRCEATDSVLTDLGDMTNYTLSHTYRYNNAAIQFILGALGRGQDQIYGGYMPIEKPDVPFTEELEQHTSHYTVDSLALSYLDRFVDKCQARGIKLIFCMGPHFSIPIEGEHDYMKEYARRHGIPFLDYHTVGLYTDRRDLWKDTGHLWHDGAVLFTERFAHDVKKLNLLPPAE